MKTCYSSPVFLVLAVLYAALLPPFAQRVVGNDLPALEQGESVDWRQDPVCRMVFFAVLEGLYTDGVPNDVVDCLVPRSGKGNPLKANFVVECPLCHPVFEALVLYQSRGTFRDSGVERSTFGHGLTEDETKALKSDSRMTRLQALRPLVHRWVDRRMNMMRLSEAEHAELSTALAQRSQQGKKRLMNLIRQDPDYNQGWSMYWGCAACNGATDACKEFKSGASDTNKPSAALGSPE